MHHPTKCRICGNDARSIGSVEYYSGFPFDIIQCEACGCRSTKSDPEIYNRLYSDGGSIYGIYNGALTGVESLFKKRNLPGLERELRQSAKYNFIISLATDLPASAKVLEIGASRGHLASFFILRGNDFVGADISADAVRSANQTFGPHFHEITSPEIAKHAPYDLIYHVGTIGCVPNPIGMTRELFKMLAPRGLLAFNAPVLEACYLQGQLWNDAANPPDLVTMFPTGFFARTFGKLAGVEERFDYIGGRDNARIAFRRTFSRWAAPTPISLHHSMSDYQSGRHHETLTERVFLKLSGKLGLHRWLKKRPAPFGYYVTMRQE